MAFPISRVKVWVALEILTAADLNAEFNNIINNLAPENIDDFATNVAEFQTETDPGEVGTESLPLSLSEELERVRFSMREMKFGSDLTKFWYETALLNLNTSLSLEHKPQIYIPFDGEDVQEVLMSTAYNGMYNGPATLDSDDNIRRGCILSDAIQSTNKKFGNFALGPEVSTETFIIIPGKYRIGNQMFVSMWFRNAQLSSTLMRNSVLGIRVEINISGNLVATFNEQTALTETTKEKTVITGSSVVHSNTTYQNLILEFSMNDDGNDFLRMYLDGTLEVESTSGTFHVTNEAFGLWQLASNVQPDIAEASWDHFSAMSVLMKSEAVDPWTGTEAASVTDGLWKSSGTNNLVNVNNIDLSDFTIELKGKITADDAINDSNSANSLTVRDDSMDRSVGLHFYTNGVRLRKGAAGEHIFIFLDMAEYHTYRITSTGAISPVTKLFVDGIERLRLTNDVADATAGDEIQFNTSSTPPFVVVEYIRWDQTLQDEDMPIGASLSIDDIGLFSGRALNTSEIALIQGARIGDSFSIEEKGPTLLGCAIMSDQDETALFGTTYGIAAPSGDIKWNLNLPLDGRTSFSVHGQFVMTLATADRLFAAGIAVTEDETDTSSDLGGLQSATEPTDGTTVIRPGGTATTSISSAMRLFVSNFPVLNASGILIPRGAIIVAASNDAGGRTLSGESSLKLQLNGKGLLI